MERFMWFLYISLLIFSALPRDSIADDSSDAHVLIQFKNNLTDPNNHLSNWGSPDSHCSWFGVTCRNGSDVLVVTWIDLSFSNLSGRLVPELRGLSNLENLILTGNYLSGGIPPELGKLNHLITLNLGSNLLTGTIPDFLGDLSNLTSLLLDDNNFTGGIPVGLWNRINGGSFNVSCNMSNNPNLTPLPRRHVCGL